MLFVLFYFSYLAFYYAIVFQFYVFNSEYLYDPSNVSPYYYIFTTTISDKTNMLYVVHKVKINNCAYKILTNLIMVGLRHVLID